jgi:hypothetical protein
MFLAAGAAIAVALALAYGFGYRRGIRECQPLEVQAVPVHIPTAQVNRVTRRN